MLSEYQSIDLTFEVYPTYSLEPPVCPSCDTFMEFLDWHIYGWRALGEYDCSSCAKRYKIDLPVFTGIPYPAVLCESTQTVVSDTPHWWKEPLEKWKILERSCCALESKDSNSSSLLILNCVDTVFGHSVNRLLWLTYFIDKTKFDNVDVLLLIPKSLRYLLNRIKRELHVLELDTTFGENKCIILEVDRQVKAFAEKYERVRLCSHPYPQPEDLKPSLLNLPVQKNVEKIDKIVIVYRVDRTVGYNLRCQSSFYKRLISRIDRYLPSIKIYLIGDKDKYSYTSAIDLRSNVFSEVIDKEWNEACSGAITIGVHGSNMLLPSLCSSHNIEFVNKDKLFNFSQATIFSDECSVLSTIHKYRYIYGNQDLSDIKVDQVFEVVRSIVAGMNHIFNAISLERTASILKAQNEYREIYKAHMSFLEKKDNMIQLWYKKFRRRIF